MAQHTFIGRTAELQRLAGHLQVAAAGRLQVAFIAGEAGAGKSYLVSEFLRAQEEADPKLITAVGECNAQTGAGDAYLPFRQLLTALTTEPEEKKMAAEAGKVKQTRLKEFVRISSQSLLTLGPDLIDIFVPGGKLLTRIVTTVASNSNVAQKLAERVGKKKAPEPAKINPTLDQGKIFEQYAAVLKALCQTQTLVLVLDDLQWADSGSLTLLFHLARELKDSRLLLLGTFRPDDVALGRDGARHPFEAMLNELKRYYGDIVLDLARTDPDEGRAFTNALIDSEPNQLDAAFREALFARTGGHPLFAVELLRDLQERGNLVKDSAGRWQAGPALDWGRLPARVEGVIGERLARLPAALHETLSIASVMGHEFAAQVVAGVQRVPERELVKDLARELERRYRLVVEQAEQKFGQQFLSSFRFSHALIQQYLYGELGAGERRRLHADIAETLENLLAEHAGELALQLARHYDEAGNAEKAIAYWIMAGDAAFAAYAHTEAMAAYGRVLEPGKQPAATTAQLQHVYARRGRALELIGQFEQALQNYTDMLAAARARHDRRMELEAQVAVSTLYSTGTSVADAAKGQALSEETLKLAAELGERAVEARVLWNLLLVNMLDNQAARAIEYGVRSLSLARELNLQEQLALTLGDLGWAYNAAGRFAEGEAVLTEAANLWREMGNLPRLTGCLNHALFGYFWSGHYQQALAVAEESYQTSRSIKNFWNQAGARHLQGEIWLETGEIDQALEALEESVRLAGETHTPFFAQWFGADLGWAYTAIGAAEKGLALYRAARVPNEELPQSSGRTPTLLAYALCEIASGQLDAAAATLAECGGGNLVWDFVVRLAKCKLALARQDEASALALAAAGVAGIQQYKLGQYLPEALFLLGQAHGRQGDRALANAAFDQARQAAEAIGARRQLWPILAALAELEPDPAKAQALRTQARETVQFMAAHIRGDDLRGQFLQSEGVRALMA